MSTLSDSDIKQHVREHYGAIARGAANDCSPGGAVTCCAPAPDVVELVSYESLAEGVVEGADLGLGCGLPTRFANLQSGQTVLDLGSGAGIDVFLAAQAVGPTGLVIGVDMTPDMLARARANAQRAGYANVEFRQGEIEALPVADDSVDVVLSNCVINLVPDKQRAFREIWRVLKSGGAFTISDMVTFGAVPDDLRADMALWAGCISGALDRDEYLEIIRSVGFRNVRVQEESVYSPESVGAGAPDQPAVFGIASVTVLGEKS